MERKQSLPSVLLTKVENAAPDDLDQGGDTTGY